jgi:hypothetical protein
MILLKRGAGDPDRVDHAVAILRPSTLDDVSSALVEYASSGGTAAYVERVGDRYRWSPATRGGPYPLLRVLARFLRCEHTELTMRFRILDDHWCVVGHSDGPDADDYVVLEVPFDVEGLSSALPERAATEHND